MGTLYPMIMQKQIIISYNKTQNNLEHLETRVGDVQKCLSQMDTTKAFGTDGVSPRLLKEEANQVSTCIQPIP